MNYAYQRRGGPLLKWGARPPAQSRASDATALGQIFEATAGIGRRAIRRGEQAMGCACDDAKVPRAGAPEFVGDYVATSGVTSTIASIDDAIHSGTGRSVAMAANAYHGYKRNGSVLWALAWAALGYTAPVITTVIATAQGFGHKK